VADWKPISGIEFMEWLEEQGVIPKERPLRRVVIDADMNGPVLLYMEEVGTDKLISSRLPQEMIDAGFVKIEVSGTHE